MPTSLPRARTIQRPAVHVAERDAPWAVLLLVFDGDAAAWLHYLEREGSAAQHRDDLPLARAVAGWCATNEGLRVRLRELAATLRMPAH